MKITEELGNEIIKRLLKYTEVNINIMNLEGKIVASTDKERVHQIHSGAKKVIDVQDEVILFNENMEDYPGSKPGMNLQFSQRSPITYLSLSASFISYIIGKPPFESFTFYNYWVSYHFPALQFPEVSFVFPFYLI